MSHNHTNAHTNTHTIYPPHLVHHNDPFRPLRERKIRTKTAWTVVPASEGYAIMEFCKSQSVAQHAEPGTNAANVFGIDVTGNPGGAGSGGGGGTIRTPCYNRETLFDEEWMAHMRDVHGLVCVWPETWIRRIEVLDLEPFGGDIGGIGELMEGT
ncbi:hypothetical protein LAWI1_G006388 [Lachnellula willkommii]|uniref:Uncharacterized protein n=1 Tax=Lachnellula willkommii TaxID=215461 RepID=A0A559M2X5_9HELO|nr:hypothetical protein LAWI1_G006388 [Lachnellula willkommii]